MKFYSQICTTKEQSERLLALGLKKETADMHHYHTVDFEENEVWYPSIIPYENVGVAFYFVGETEICLENNTIPAWSLHRLIEIMPQWIHTIDGSFKLTIDQGKLVCYREISDEVQTFVFGHTSLYDSIIDIIEKLIKEDHFNKEYLED